MERYTNLRQSGLYRAQVLAWGFGQSKKNVTFFWIELDLLGRVEQRRPEELVACPEGRAYYRKPLVGGAVAWLLADLRSLGFRGESFAALNPHTPGAHNFEGVVATV